MGGDERFVVCIEVEAERELDDEAKGAVVGVMGHQATEVLRDLGYQAPWVTISEPKTMPVLVTEKR